MPIPPEMVPPPAEKPLAVWAVTANGVGIAQRLRAAFPGMRGLCLERFVGTTGFSGVDSLIPAVRERFGDFTGHIFVMAAGIVVRAIAPVIGHKATDPAVVVVDDTGRFAVSLLSGHMGGANRLAREVAAVLGAAPVITTATDVNQLPAVDTIVVEAGMRIANPTAIREVNAAVLAERPVPLFDRWGLLAGRLPTDRFPPVVPTAVFAPWPVNTLAAVKGPAVLVDDAGLCLPPSVLAVRPPTLVVGIGCNRGTPEAEIEDLLRETLSLADLAVESICALASVDLKADEVGLLALGRRLGVPVVFFTKTELARVSDVPNPSPAVAEHIGVDSVCEAAAILGADSGRLIVPKRKTRAVTVAIARKSSIS
ncbi:MAG: cobalt-precorrin 5A hydrolase [Pseudomonadota bacterium]